MLMSRNEITDIIKKEGNTKTFTHKGVMCNILRHPSFMSLCGYVDLVKDIPEYGKCYDDIGIHCHGGLTYGVSNGKFWRIGFDCAHSGDLLPYMILNDSSFYRSSSGTYRNMEYVTNEIKSIIDQLDIINNGLISNLYKKMIRSDKLKTLIDE